MLTWLKSLLRARARRNAERRALMAALHYSASWHCGCWDHERERALVRAGLDAGKVVRRRLLGGVSVETVQLSADDFARLRR